MKATRAYRPGETYPTNHGSLVIQSNSERMNFRWVRFIATGFVREARIDHIKSGKVSDVYHPTVLGIGYMGEGQHKAKFKAPSGIWYANRVYGLWSAMLQRCYRNPCSKHTYHEAEVHSDWHNFQTFAEDFPKLEGYAGWCLNGSDHQLDKDKYGKGSKLYSLATCCLIPHLENQLLKVAYNGCIKPKTI